MQRIDTSTAVNNKFVNGNAAQGVKGTQVSAEWLNAVQEELANTIEGAGVTLDSEKNNQLLNVLKSSVVNKVVNGSKEIYDEESGYTKISDTLDFSVPAKMMVDATLMFSLLPSNTTSETTHIAIYLGSAEKDYAISTTGGGTFVSLRFVYRNTSSDAIDVVVKGYAASNKAFIINPTIQGAIHF